MSLLDDIIEDLSSSREDLVDYTSKTNHELLSLFEDDISPEDRIKIIDIFYDRDKNLIIECVNNIINTYAQYKNSFKKELLLWLTTIIYFSFPIRIRCLEQLYDMSVITNDVSDKYLTCIEDVISQPLNFKRKYEVGTTLIWNLFKNIIKSRDVVLTEELIDRLTNVWKCIVTDTFLQEDFRYKLLQSLCNDNNFFEDAVPTDKEIKFRFSEVSLLVDWEDYRYFMYIIQFIISTDKLKTEYLDTLINLIKERNLNGNAVADIADFLLGIVENNPNHTLPENIEDYTIKGKELLDSISFEGKGPKTFYNNSQNIHKLDVDTTINPFIEKLLSLSLDIPTTEDEYNSFVDVVVDNIKEYSSNLEYELDDQLRVIGAINRFILDNTLYSKYNVSLLNLLIRSYYYIQTHEFKDELMERLCQELCDMADTCTTGHIYRLVNIFSGYEVSVTIPVEEEIKGCVYARLQTIIQNKTEEEQTLIFDSIGDSEEIKNRSKVRVDTTSSLVGTEFAHLDDKGEVIKGILREEDIIKTQMLSKVEDPEVVFNRLLGKDISNLLDELRKEYSNVISEQDLDVYFRKAINMFQVGM
jgi:hypothetical protein